MKILIIRHAEPDYSIDSLTPTGWKEAEALADRMEKIPVDAFYVSPLGRAQDTAGVTLKRLGREATTLPWLREFGPTIEKPGITGKHVIWDWLPKEWTREPQFYNPEAWHQVPVMAQAGVPEMARQVTEGLDALLAEHGYVRDGKYYRTEQGNEKTIALFCHFGLECVLLSHLIGVSPMTLWHGFCAAPSSITTVATEERREGIAFFRTIGFGDTSHLYAAGMEPSFAARFCETYATRNPNRD